MPKLTSTSVHMDQMQTGVFSSKITVGTFGQFRSTRLITRRVTTDHLRGIRRILLIQINDDLITNLIIDVTPIHLDNTEDTRIGTAENTTMVELFATNGIPVYWYE